MSRWLLRSLASEEPIITTSNNSRGDYEPAGIRIRHLLVAAGPYGTCQITEKVAAAFYYRWNNIEFRLEICECTALVSPVSRLLYGDTKIVHPIWTVSAINTSTSIKRGNKTVLFFIHKGDKIRGIKKKSKPCCVIIYRLIISSNCSVITH